MTDVKRTSSGGRWRTREIRTFCFDATGTPKRGFTVDCCHRAEAILPEMLDQHLALCLDAARRGGKVWVDPRDGELWWVQEYGERVPESPQRRETPHPVIFQSARGTVGSQNVLGRPVTELEDDELIQLFDEGDPL